MLLKVICIFAVHYGVFTPDGASSSKKPLNTQEPWVSRVDLQLIPPPLSVASLIRSIAMNEGHVVPSSSQLFISSDTMTPLSDDHILVEGENWLGSTADDYIVFLSRNQYRPNFIEGSRYFIKNHSTTRALFLRGTYFTTYTNFAASTLPVWNFFLLFVNIKEP